jgi:hypothetical protein
LRRFIPLLFFAAIILILIYALLLGTPETASLEYPEEETGCSEGQTQHCSVGNCSGLSTCVKGSWSPCRLERVCTPGEKVPCIERGCAKGHKVCNDCGTAYNPCVTH